MRYLLIRLKDFLIEEPKWTWRWYRPFRFFGKRREKPLYVFMADGKRNHGGMFDRIKGILTLFALSKVHGADFKIFFTSPFELGEYLDVNEYDWKKPAEKLCYHFPVSKPLIVYGECFHPQRLLRRHKGETHVYYGFDNIDMINALYGKDYEFGSLYRELFKPNKRLRIALDNMKLTLGDGYIVCHTRFMNLLGDKVEVYGEGCKVLPEEKRVGLMADCRKAVKHFMDLYKGSHILMATDSEVFSAYIKRELPEVMFVEGTVKHIDTMGKTTDEENIKLFLDYYVMAEASRVVSLVGGDLYPSQFPKYAARIGGVPFERYILPGYEDTPWIIQ